jgi:hypothetical protein
VALTEVGIEVVALAKVALQAARLIKDRASRARASLPLAPRLRPREVLYPVLGALGSRKLIEGERKSAAHGLGFCRYARACERGAQLSYVR